MKYKKRIYVFFTIVLGIICSYIIHAGSELLYLQYADEVVWYTHFGIASCSLPPFIAYSLLIIGGVGGYFLGLMWWNIVYVEKRHWRFKKQHTNNEL